MREEAWAISRVDGYKADYILRIWFRFSMVFLLHIAPRGGYDEVFPLSTRGGDGWWNHNRKGYIWSHMKVGFLIAQSSWLALGEVYQLRKGGVELVVLEECYTPLVATIARLDLLYLNRSNNSTWTIWLAYSLEQEAYIIKQTKTNKHITG